ncbi:MAG: DUF4340 domain-containing protein, partial [Anaerolineaceae bacterium]|nr:DUF4340 domain-containing protein [Anaerolineaceae bacterium]
AGKFALERADYKWRLVEPVDGPGNRIQADLLARLLAEMSYQRTLKLDPEKLKQVGLDPAVATVRFTVRIKDQKKNKDKDKDDEGDGEPTYRTETHDLEIGKQTGLGTDRYTYVRVKGKDQAYLVDGQLHEVVTAELHEFRDKNLFDFGPGRIAGVTVVSKHGEVAAERTGSRWTITAPVRARGDAEAIDGLVGAATGLKVDSFVTDALEDPARYGLQEPRLTISLQEKVAKPAARKESAEKDDQQKGDQEEPQPVVHTLIVGSNADVSGTKVFARLKGSPTVVTLKDSKVRELEKDLFALREKRAIPLEGYKVEHLAIDLDGSAVVLDKSGGRWQIQVPEKAAAEDGQVSDLIERMGELKINKFVDGADPKDAKLGFDKPYGTITFRHRGDVKDTSVLVGRNAKADQMWVLDVGTRVAGRVDPADVTPLKRTWLDLLKREIWKAGDDQRTSKLTWTRDGETVTIVNTGSREKGVWKMTSPLAQDLDGEKASKLAEKFDRLEAQKFLGRAEKAADFGLDKPQLRLEVTISSAAEPEKSVTHTLLVTEAGGRCRAMTEGGRLVFEISKELIEELDKPLTSKAWSEFDKERVIRLEVRGPNFELNFNRNGDQWSVDNVEGFSANSMRVRWVLGDLAKLEAKRVVRYSTKDLAQYGLDKPAWRFRVKGLTVDKVLLVSATGPGSDRYATIEGSGLVVTLSDKNVNQVIKGKSYYRAGK